MDNNICGRAKLEFKQKAQDKLDEWFGGEDKYEVLFWWFDDTIAYTCVKTETPRLDSDFVKTLYFFRLFELCGIMEISQDRKVEI